MGERPTPSSTHDSPCRTCGRTLATNNAWCAGSRAEQQAWASGGYAKPARRDLCHDCYLEHRAHGTLPATSTAPRATTRTAPQWTACDRCGIQTTSSTCDDCRDVASLPPRAYVTPLIFGTWVQRHGIQVWQAAS